jgi:hypothetical protein
VNIVVEYSNHVDDVLLACGSGCAAAVQQERLVTNDRLVVASKLKKDCKSHMKWPSSPAFGGPAYKSASIPLWLRAAVSPQKEVVDRSRLLIEPQCFSLKASRGRTGLSCAFCCRATSNRSRLERGQLARFNKCSRWLNSRLARTR